MFRREENRDVLKKRASEDRPLRNILVTGGCGFIGSNFINVFGRKYPDVHLFNIDKMDYCANSKSIEIAHENNYHFIHGDIRNSDLVMHIFTTHDIDTVVNFAAQSHVDNSFGNSITFSENNILGTHNLLECSRVYGKIAKFIHVSTDEVYGEVSQSQSENGTLNPTNPYAATKAAAEFIVKSYHISFGLPCIITRGNNVYGRYQYPEKVIPRFIMLMHQGRKLTIQGTGANTRTFIHATDVARAFERIVVDGIIGDVYNIGSREEHSVLDLAERIHGLMRPDEPFAQCCDFVKDREFNDQRYDIDTSKLKGLGWDETVPFDEGLADTVRWYSEEALPNGFWPEIKMTIACSQTKDPHRRK
jgi:dTDP-glucose 4,6-dehydratase